MKMPYTVLIADDEPKIVEVLTGYLEKEGYQVVPALTGGDVLRLLESVHPALIILDLMLPDLSGEQVCMHIRAKSSVPILMLTAKHSEADRLTGLRIGADDYVTKPFSVKEVVARVGVILRRAHSEQALADRLVYREGELVIDGVKQVVYKQGVDADLTGSEFRILTILSRNPQRVFSREELIEKAFGIEFRGDSRAIDAHIKNLRAKIEDDPRHPVYVQTVYGAGYRFGGGNS